MAVLPTGIGPVTGYQIERSLRFNSADTAYLSYTNRSTTNRQAWTWSCWVKRSTINATFQAIFAFRNGVSTYSELWFDSNEKLHFDDLNGGTVQASLITSAVYRDPSAWYHVVLVWDSNNATPGDRARLYVNGSRITTTGFSTQTLPGSGVQSMWNFPSVAVAIGRETYGPQYYFNGYLTEINFIDGSALDPNSFGQFNANTGVWEPKAYTGSYSGTNSFYLKFADNSNTTAATLGKDSSGNGNNWTPNNFSVTAGAGNDSLVDSPTSYGTDTGVGGEVRGNYCTLNPLDKGTNATLANGNLFGSTSTTAWAMIRSTFAMSSGKWYWEFTVATTQIIIGLAKSNASLANYVGSDANGWGWYGATGNKVNGGTQVTYVGVWAANDVIGVSFDADVGTLVFYKNGTSQGTAYTGLTSGPYFPAISFSSASDSANANFGQRAFAYTAPSGFKALCTQNLPTPTIGATSTTQANDYFDVVTRNGNNSSYTVSGLGFTPDFFWTKCRNTALAHYLADSVRGNDQVFFSNLTNAEVTEAAYITATSSNGYTLGAGPNVSNYNGTGGTYVDWLWKANGAGSSNTAGTITSTVSANTTSGFSIVTYTGTGANATVGHGLGVAPSMVIVKNRSVGSGWRVYHVSLTSAAYVVYLNATLGQTLEAVAFNSTAPTSSVFSVGASGDTNGSGNLEVAYCFAAVPGYSAFGSYTGNGAADGPFIYTGFRPRFILAKSSTTAATNWFICDTSRSPENVADEWLLPNGANAEQSNVVFDILSNGFKLRNSAAEFNTNVSTYIYAAFAESPFKYSLAR